MWEWISNKIMATIIIILALVVAGFYFFPDATQQVLGNVVRSAKPIATGFVDLVKNLIGYFVK